MPRRSPSPRRPARCRRAGARDERLQPGDRRRPRRGAQHHRALWVDDGGPLGGEARADAGDERGEELADGPLGEDVGRDLERIHEGVRQPGHDDSHVLDVDGVELADLCEHQRDQLVARQVDRQLVDDAAVAALQDVDTDDVASDRADTARHRAERSRAVGQPDPHDEARHAPHIRQRL